MSLSKTLALCAAAALTLGASLAEAKTIALVTINQQALFFNQINDGAKEAAKAAGVELVIHNANNVECSQNDAIENYITQKVDGIILVAIDVNGVKPAVTAAKAAGIPVIAVDAQIPDGDNAAFVGVDNTAAGEEIGKFFADYVKKDMGGSGQARRRRRAQLLHPEPAARRLQEGGRGVGAKVTFLDTVDGQNMQDVALSAGENLMTANPDMTTIYATGEPALIGAVSAVTARTAPATSRCSAGTSPRSRSKASTRAGLRPSSSRTPSPKARSRSRPS